jgi:2',3'-cyclic-nucleotide 2'-phosphodiesterase (5'-nucleotidase family)
MQKCLPLLLALLVTASGCAHGRTVTLTILHTNDWHGYALPRDTPEGQTGGVVACLQAVEQIRTENPGAVLVLDAGDLLSGHPAVGFEDEGLVGLAFCQLWDQIGFDAFVLGNHELDHGRENLEGLLERMESPAVCANWLLVDPGNAADATANTPPSPLTAAPVVQTQPYLVVERAGIRVGIVGLVTDELAGVASKKTMAGTACLAPATALAAVWQRLEAESDLQIALTHCGIETDVALAEAFPGLDAIVGGHSHIALNEPRMVGTTPIVHAGCNGRLLGRLDLEIEVHSDGDGNDAGNGT